MSNDSLQGGADRPRGKLRLRYGEEGTQAPLLIYHPLAACLMAGLGAGLLAFAAGELSYGSYDAREIVPQIQRTSPDQPTTAARDWATAGNAALADAWLGAFLGLYLGMAGGMIRGDVRRCAGAGVAGLACGGLAGWLLPAAVLPHALRLRDGLDLHPLVAGAAVQALTWGPIAAVAGAAFGHAMGGPRSAPRFALFAFVGAAAAGLAYVAAGTAFFPTAQTEQPLAAERRARLLAHMLVAVGASAAVGLSLTGRRRRSQRWPWEESREVDDAAAPAITPGAS